MADKDLNERQLAFCNHYMTNGFNGTQAAIDAGYSPKTAKSMASRLLTNVNIQARIRALKSENSKRYEITKDTLMAEAAKVAFGSLGDLVEIDGGELKLREGADHSALDMLDSVGANKSASSGLKSFSESSSFRFKKHDKLKALEFLAKLIGAFDEGTDDKKNREAKSERVLGILAGIAERKSNK